MTEQLTSAEKQQLIDKVKQEIAIANVSELLKVCVIFVVLCRDDRNFGSHEPKICGIKRKVIMSSLI